MKFIVEQYELYSQKYLVEADSEAEAVRKVLDDADGEMVGESEYLEVCEDMGHPLTEWAEEFEEYEDFVPSIRSVEAVEAEESDNDGEFLT